VQGTTVNIAPSGLLIEAADTDAVTGDVVEFHLYLPDNHDKTVSGEATVVRHGEDPVAVAVTDESTDARAALGSLVVTRSRAALHRNDPVGPEGPTLAAVRGYHRAVRLRPFLDFAGGRL
jgi:PilZ domain